MRKTFVLDTNVLLHDPEALGRFPDSTVVIPLTVLEELDNMKRLPSELGKNAREVGRQLVLLRKRGQGDYHQGLHLDNGSEITIQMEIDKSVNGAFDISINDNKILMAALYLQRKGKKVIFVSKDIGARVKAETIGLTSQDYENLKVSYNNLFKGVRRVELPKHDIDLFYKDGSIPFNGDECTNNEYLVLTSPEHSSAVGRYSAEKKAVEPLLNFDATWGIQPRNVEQRCAMDSLLRDDIKLVTLLGPAGTGKTLLSLACALRKVFDEGVYSRVLISRPIVPLGRDIGYLPGTKEEKLMSWMQPIYDNLEYVCNTTGQGNTDTLDWVLDSDKIEMEAVTYIRGRSLPKMFFIIDEAQNLTPHEVKTIISRAGDGTKVILAGDPTQIDNPYLDKDSNGLTFTVDKFQGQKLFSQIFLDKTERSELAKIAAEVM